MALLTIALVTGIVFGPATPASAAPPITEYPIPTASSGPYGIAAGPDGNLWFTESNANKIGKISPSGVITEYPIPTANSTPRGITAGPDGNLWFTEYDGIKIGKITLGGVITEYDLPAMSFRPSAITAGPDGNLWFAYGPSIGKITPAGVITFVGLQEVVGSVNGITAGPDGNVWFTTHHLFPQEGCVDTVGKVTPAGQTTQYQFGVCPFPAGITAGPDGNLWFAEFWPYSAGFSGNTYRIGKVTLAGVVTEYLVPTPDSSPVGITAGPDGNLWFTKFSANQIAKITPQGFITEYAIPTSSTFPQGITAGPDGNLWFTESSGNQIGKLAIPKSIVYMPLAPCRIMDTRTASPDSGVQGPVVGGTLYNFPGFIAAGSNWSLFGGSGSSDCGLNDTVGVNIQAIAIVITILNPNFDAFLGVGDINDLNSTLSTVALNYTADQGLSTMYIVPQTTSNTIYFALPADLSANLVFDVVGYFVTSDATALQCTTQASAPATIGASGGTGSATSPSCAAGYALTSGSCDSDAFAMKLVSDKGSGQAWFCSAINAGGTDAHLSATANCCRVAGR